MPSPLDSVRAQLIAFFAGGEYAALWDAVAEAAELVDDDVAIPDAERDWFDELYDAVYMAVEDPVSRDDAKAGMIGAAQLRVQLRELGLARHP